MTSRLILPTTKTLIKSFATSSAQAKKFVLPTLPYSYSALEPAISGQIMEVHHTKHHQAYVNNLNNTIAAYADAEASNDVQKMIALQPALRFNGGGHVNHSIFWTNLAPPKEGGGGKPTGDLLKEIEKSYGSFDKVSCAFAMMQRSATMDIDDRRIRPRLQRLTHAAASLRLSLLHCIFVFLLLLSVQGLYVRAEHRRAGQRLGLAGLLEGARSRRDPHQAQPGPAHGARAPPRIRRVSQTCVQTIRGGRAVEELLELAQPAFDA